MIAYDRQTFNELFEQFQQQVGKWSTDTFPIEDARAAIDHAKDELDEIAEDPDDAHEYADVILTLLGLAHRRGVNVADALTRKFEWCKKRTWGEPDQRGVVRHVTKGVAEQMWIELHPPIKPVVDDVVTRTIDATRAGSFSTSL